MFDSTHSSITSLLNNIISLIDLSNMDTKSQKSRIDYDDIELSLHRNRNAVQRSRTIQIEFQDNQPVEGTGMEATEMSPAFKKQGKTKTVNNGKTQPCTHK
jgi:hypothetical protein